MLSRHEQKPDEGAAARAKAEQASGDLDAPTDSSSDEEPAVSSSPLGVLPAVRPVEGKQLRVFARGEWKQTLVLEASEGGARVQVPAAGQTRSSTDYASRETAWVTCALSVKGHCLRARVHVRPAAGLDARCRKRTSWQGWVAKPAQSSRHEN